MLKVLIFHIAFLVLCTSTDPKPVKIIALFRHGMRAPINAFHADPYVDEKHWPDGYGRLVQHGKWQMFTLGQQLHKRYSHVLLPYNSTVKEDVKLVTTSVGRCYDSGALVLAGFYPPNKDQLWNEDLLWQPVPVKYGSPDKVHIIGKKNICPKYDEELQVSVKRFRNTPVVQYLMQYLANLNMSIKTDTMHDLFLIGDYIHTKHSLGLPLPEWAEGDFFEKLKIFYVDSFDILTETPVMKKLLAGPLLTDVIERIKDSLYGSPNDSKFYFYSGHDTSLHSLLKGLGFELDFVPRYGASIIFEVYNLSANNHAIKLLYSKNYTMEVVETMIIPGCEELCPLGKLIQLHENMIKQDWESECGKVEET